MLARVNNSMSTPAFSFIHAADLHLGAAFAGLTRQAADLAAELEKATYTALDNLVRLALAKKTDAVLLAGDAYNRETGSAKALLALRDACAALGDAGISVFMVHGNHDPLSGPGFIAWPDNVHIFGTEAPAHVPLVRGGKTLALVHGISHARRDVTDNLAALFKRAPADVFQIGLLHCQVGGAGAGHLPYAPCTVDDLTRAGMDYWALGHVHKRGQVCAAPPAHYAGNIQGLHINEDGAKGCLLVNVRQGRAEAAFQALAPVQWLNISVSLDGADKLDALEQRVLSALEGACAQDTQDPPVTAGFIARLTLGGRTDLSPELRGGWGAELLERLRLWGRARAPFVWIKDLRLATSPRQDMDSLKLRDDLLGETLRRIGAWGADPDLAGQLLAGPLAELYGPGASQARAAGLTPLAPEDLRDLLNEAALMCLEALTLPEKS